MSQARSEPPASTPTPAPTPRIHVVADRDTLAAMRTFCALRAQISPNRRVTMIPNAAGRAFRRVGRGTAVALRNAVTVCIGRSDT